MDTITLKSLSYHAKHGFYEEERVHGNQFEVDLVAKGHFRKSAGGEELSKTFDYEQAEKAVRSIMNGRSEYLIETLCAEIGEALFNRYSIVETLQVSVRKLNPPLQTDALYAEITMEWTR
ncbi:dihydroneopterin aldolase [Rhodohalobacter mucosus]|uniref:dihydroneopterin aldolase n=1 Tax=Rhodohalobacter mucosus TaxID=2079485 RepID=UPI001304AD8D|nr:dihydroneopterin aldolase [Rhodohalobacter mucosus]